MDFSEKLKAARKAKKLTQQDLADRLNLNRSSIAKYETSSSVPPVKTILKLCEILEISFENCSADKNLRLSAKPVSGVDFFN